LKEFRRERTAKDAKRQDEKPREKAKQKALRAMSNGKM
jgi:hypothetical protein